MSQPWNEWYHVVAHVYGSWLPGDSRGWRARHHRDHIDGDYKNPLPRGLHDRLFQYSKILMKRDSVRIEFELRQFVLDAVVEKLNRDQIEVAVASLDAKHLHILGRFPDHNVRHWVGRAKKHASHLVRQEGLRSDEGGLWAKRCHPKPITASSHFAKAMDYVRDHKRFGAATFESADRGSANTAIVPMEEFNLLLEDSE